MMNTRVTLFVVVAFALCLATAAVAANVQFGGKITAIDTASSQLTVATATGNVTVQVVAGTVIKMGAKVLTFADLRTGMTVQGCGTVQGDLIVASRINVKYQGK